MAADAPSPSGLPALCLVMADFGFYVRIETDHAIDAVMLPDEVTLPGAVRAADALGHRCEFWINSRVSGKAHRIPASIVRVPAST